MNRELYNKIRCVFSLVSIYKNSTTSSTLFAGRNLPSFVKDFILQKNADDTGFVDATSVTSFLDRVIPSDGGSVKSLLTQGKELQILARFVVQIDLQRRLRRFSIPDLGIKYKDGIIPDYVYTKHQETLIDGEKWGIIKLCIVPDDNGQKYHVEMTEYKPFKPYRSVDVGHFRSAREEFSTTEWIDFLLSAMEYNADGFSTIREKLEMLSRLLIFVEPRLNMIELAPKGTGKSYVFGNISKFGWLVSGGKVTRAKLFFDKQRQQYGIFKNHDFVVFDEIQTMRFDNPAEMRSILKSYLESGKATIDDSEFISQCGLMLMGNIRLGADRMPVSKNYFYELPEHFRESALLDRFHGFIEGWYMPRIHKGMVYNGWTISVEYFSEILHSLRTENCYAQIFDSIVSTEERADLRDFKAVKKLATGYIKLLFPHWTSVDRVNISEFEQYCLFPAIQKRSIIKTQCHIMDPEFKCQMPTMTVSSK